MKSIKLAVLLCAVFATSAISQTLVVTDFADWDTPTAVGWGAFNGWSTTNPGTVTSQGGIGTYQLGTGGSDLSQFEGGTFTLNFTISNLTADATDSINITFFDTSSSVLNTFSTPLVIGANTFTVTLGTGNYESFSNLEISTTGLSIFPAQSFSGTFTNASFTAIPEPSTYALLLIGGAALLALRRKQAVKA
jgi:hypothetical protein